MFKKLEQLALVLLLILIAAMGCQNDQILAPTAPAEEEVAGTQSENGKPIEGQYIVVFDKKEVLPFRLGKVAMISKAEAAIQKLTEDYQISKYAILQKYHRSLQGFTARLTDEQLSRLKKDKRVSYIEQDRIITLGKKPRPPRGGGNVSQTTPWGITRIGGATDGTGKTAWVLDTGVDFDHPDLNVDVSRSATFITKGKDSKTADDFNGHGTNVAGIIAAIDNNIDVVGVAAGATIVAVKVLDRTGSGTYSGVIAGVDYVAKNASSGDIANMSLGGPISKALDDAVQNAADAGVIFAIAAGNESDDANNFSPARVEHSNVFTISAFDKLDNFASFSNWSNPPIEFSAPGVYILSLYKNGGTSTMSGTSQATPHVAGLLLITNGNPKTDGYVNNDPDGDADPIAHK